MPFLSVTQLTVGYHQPIIRDLSFSLQEKESIVLLGPSGCGKSTLLKAIAGLLIPFQGRMMCGQECFFDGKTHFHLPAEKRRIGFVFQNYALWPHMSVTQNIAYPLKCQGWERDAIAKRVSQLLEAVQLEKKAAAFPHSLSGGEKQRVALARALAPNPRFLLLDEPLANIDAALKEYLIHLIKNLQQEWALPMIYVTHDQNEAFEMADRVMLMQEGKILQTGAPKELFHNPCNAFAARFLGCKNIVPYEQFNRWPHRQVWRFERKEVQEVAIPPWAIQPDVNGPYQGRIEKIVFKGSITTIHLQCYGWKLVYHTPHANRLNVGQVIRFELETIHPL